MKEPGAISGYKYADAGQSPAHDYLLPAVNSELEEQLARLGDQPARLFDLGCGNGSVAAALAGNGWEVSGVDPSGEGIAEANRAFPDLQLALLWQIVSFGIHKRQNP